ncbi:ABC transporter ATP-binding protein [Jeotgalibacillus proteolyticus]|uniref:ABC transporter ATP-binding protein n=1 Tax=Jeotgalibacillus proteolyticus TaxID=2082395 RepID=A0A2S5G8F3_9BACL|nr:ABC transporter ATP-binding protein [Jeotgalibacillus proteolyticus]PPA69223.1 ABC transporter ATP-binding protein [Jeotgalibacillus proteolyticus]
MKQIMFFLKQIHSFAGRVLYVNLAAMMAIGLLEGVAVLLLIPLIGLTGIIDFDSSSIPLAGIFSFMDDVPVHISLPVILSVFVILAITQNLLYQKITIRNTIIQQGFLRHLRNKTYNGILHSKWHFFINKRKSDLVNILTSEVVRASSGTQSVLQFMSSLITTMIQIVLALLLAPTITIFILLCGGVLVLFNRKFLKRSLELGMRNYELGKRYIGGITDQINGIKDIKSNSLERSRLDWYADITHEMQREQVEYMKLRTTSQVYYKAASAILIAAFIYIALMMFNAQLAQLMLIIVIFSRLWPRVAGIQASLEQIATVLPAFKAVQALQQECRVQEEFVENQQIDPMQLNHQIECKGVYFRYNQQEPDYTLENVDFTVPAYKMTAFVGRSGAGKSTLVDLLMGLNHPEKGEVLLDGKVLTKQNVLSLRRAMSYVPQDPFLFNTTVRENLQLVKPDATDEDLWEALQFASADSFVEKLPQGLDTLIGDRGIKLSGGERQRVVLARAILRKPSILVLDEATSSLDTESEAHIQEALERLKGKMTILVIAHRLSTIRNSDQVIVLDEGKIVQKGGFKQLAQDKSKVFNHLLKKQVEIAP